MQSSRVRIFKFSSLKRRPKVNAKENGMRIRHRLDLDHLARN